jgi:hypothetical protein
MKEEYMEKVMKDGVEKEVKKEKRVERPREEWLLLKVEPMISKKIFDKAQEKLTTNKYKFNNSNKPVINHLFA